MYNFEGDILRSSMRKSFAAQGREDKTAQIFRQNIGITTYDLTPNEAATTLAQAKRLGYSPLRLADIAKSIAIVLGRENINLPQGKKNKQERGLLIEDILNRISLRHNDDKDLHIQLTTQQDDGINTEDITELLREQDELLDSMAQELANDPMAIGKLINFINRNLKNSHALAVEQNSPGQFEFDGPRIIAVHGSSSTVTNRKKADAAVNADIPQIAHFEILRESTRHAQIARQRHELERAFDRREIQAVLKFTYDQWPTDPLMTHLRSSVTQYVDAFCRERSPLCDAKDLKYQTLFRLTTYEVPDLFENGQALEQYLISAGAYTNWRNILRLDSQRIRGFNLNTDLVKGVMEEQYGIIEDRLRASDLPLEEVLTPTGIFAEAGWVIQRRNGSVNAVKEDTASSISDAVPLEFREMDPKEAMKFHRDLHYIHTPRADLAFGLYVRGECIPFSVLALEEIDRPYKENVLIFQGYDPTKCYDLTRLYSKPGTPGNTSSSMFTLTFQHLKTNYPDTQAVLSSFMPSYATGVSMTSGGFDNPVLVKPLAHRFVERNINGGVYYEHMTNRRLTDTTGKVIRSKLPLLPTVELMTTLRPPRYTPLPGAQTHMLEIY